MSFLKNIFNKKDKPVNSYNDFWNWFQINEKDFFSFVKQHKNIEKGFFNKIAPKLNELKEGIFYLTGMCDDDTAELVLTADGNTKTIAFVEDIIRAAPKIDHWKFTALKPSLDIQDVSIEIFGHKFNKENLSFYSNELPGYPDEIDITIVHDDLTEENRQDITTGIYIFLDNYLGELDFVTNVDVLDIIGKQDAKQDLVSIDKLKSFLAWRQKEFIEKYEGLRHDTENDNYTVLEAELESGNVLIALVNSDLLSWDSKASHPWISTVTIKYDGRNNNGMPDEETSRLLTSVEDDIMEELKDIEGYLNIGRQTSKNEREIYFACRDFRRPSKVLYQVQKDYSGKLEMDYTIRKDKYWQSFERFTDS